MGLFDLAASMLGGSNNQAADTQGGAGNLLATVFQTLNNQPGGIAGILQSLQQGGAGDAVKSWIGTGQNTPVSSATLQSILGSGMLQDLAANLGVSPDTAGSHLSELLPGIVDHLTPNGEVPQGGFEGAGADLIKGLLGKTFGF